VFVVPEGFRGELKIRKEDHDLLDEDDERPLDVNIEDDGKVQESDGTKEDLCSVFLQDYATGPST
jgi:hypothetical protein